MARMLKKSLVVCLVAISTCATVARASATPESEALDSIAAYAQDDGSLASITHVIRADKLWETGVTGAGVDIAVIDTGVAPVPGLVGKIVTGPDLSFDVPYLTEPGLDAFGHGTHIASIAAGADPADGDPTSKGRFVGVAPGARIVNVKVGAFDGTGDVLQVIAAINWVVQHKNDNGLNIKVLNLSYGTRSTQPYQEDPLSWAAEIAWRNGIVVVASAGNNGVATSVTSPAYNPNILAVGAVDQTQMPLSAAAFTSASGPRQPDLWAPGSHVLGLRVPGSFIDTNYSSAAVGPRLFRGTGTSQAAAVVSGGAALLVSAFPSATPDQIRAALVESGKTNGHVTNFIQLDKAAKLLENPKALNFVPLLYSPGLGGQGSLESARGGTNVAFGGTPLVGERDLFDNPWDGYTTALNALNKTSWTGGTFNGAGWAGAGWAGAGWAGAGWAGAGWAGAGWAGAGWAGAGWAGAGWAGAGWAGAGWAGAGWQTALWS